MLLSGNGQKLTVPGKNIKIVLTQEFDRKELSGDGSGSDFATGGNKPKTISVSLILPDDKEPELRNLFAFAEALNKDGDPVEYTVADRLCQALNIRKVIFVDSIKVEDSDSLRAWNVSFMLRDSANTAALREERAEEKLHESEAAADGETKLSTANPGKITEAMRK